MIKVLMVVCQMNRGGLESRLMDIIKTIDYGQVCIDFFSYHEEPGTLDNEIRALGGTIYYNPPLNIKNMSWYVNYFKDFLTEHPEYQIVHAQVNAWCSVFCKGAYMAGIPVRIAHSRTALKVFSIKNAVKNIIKLPTRKYATHYFAVSDLAGKWLFGKRNIKNKNVEVWKNAIDCSKFRFNSEIRNRKRQELGIEDKKVLIHVGNFTPPKNQSFLISILEEIEKKYDNIVLLLVGGGLEELHRKTEYKVLKKGLQERVLFLGERNDVFELLQAGDVFCFPSLYEGLPGAVLEAQAAGLPCIISDSITKEVKVLETTKFVSLKEPVEIWVEAIEHCFDINRRDTYEEMAAAGFDIKSLAEKLTKFYLRMGEKYVIRKDNK